MEDPFDIRTPAEKWEDDEQFNGCMYILFALAVIVSIVMAWDEIKAFIQSLLDL